LHQLMQKTIVSRKPRIVTDETRVAESKIFVAKVRGHDRLREAPFS
jgi:hypothetical protein